MNTKFSLNFERVSRDLSPIISDTISKNLMLIPKKKERNNITNTNASLLHLITYFAFIGAVLISPHLCVCVMKQVS